MNNPIASTSPQAFRQRCPRGGPDEQQAEQQKRHAHPASRGCAERDRAGGGCEPGAGRFVEQRNLNQRNRRERGR